MRNHIHKRRWITFTTKQTDTWTETDLHTRKLAFTYVGRIEAKNLAKKVRITDGDFPGGRVSRLFSARTAPPEICEYDVVAVPQ